MVFPIIKIQMKKCIELPEEHIKFCLTLPKEFILLAKREHIFVPSLKLVFIALLAIVLVTAGTFIHIVPGVIFDSLPIFLAFTLITLAVFANLALKVVFDWYYHIYIATNRKLIEIRSKPFFSDKIYNVFLDQVRTTEVDTSIPTFVHEFLDMGNVIIGFDRPSHEEAFTLTNVKEPEETASFMGDVLEGLMRGGPVWFGPEKSTEVIKFTEDIFPPQIVAHI